MTTRFDMENQAIQRRIAIQLERIADAIERLQAHQGTVMPVRELARIAEALERPTKEKK